MKTSESTQKNPVDNPLDHDADYFCDLCTVVRHHFNQSFKQLGPSLFAVRPKQELYLAFISNLPEGFRQEHTCSCCRRFIQSYGHLAFIDQYGAIVPAIWPSHLVDGIPHLYVQSIEAMRKSVQSGRVEGVYIWDNTDPHWGTPKTGWWYHFSIPAPQGNHSSQVTTPGQAAAQKIQDFGTLSHGLAEFDKSTIEHALNLLQADQLYRGDQFVKPLEFLLSLHNQKHKKHIAPNHIWRAVASAPVGFCTPRSSMVGTLLTDIQSGLSLDTVKRNWTLKMNPELYRRPQAPPSEGSIKAAESLFEKLQLAPALERRFANFEEVEFCWRPSKRSNDPEPGGIFGHLKTKQDQAETRPSPSQQINSATKITMSKFIDKVLHSCHKIEVYLPHHNRVNLAGIIGPVHPDAPPILQWDTERQRNPYSWYVHKDGSYARQWNLDGGWHAVSAVTKCPALWHENNLFSDKYSGFIFLIPGCVDTDNSNICLFPECMKSDLHGVRSVIEAHSATQRLQNHQNAGACGLMISRNSGHGSVIRVTTNLGVIPYHIDRWD